MTQVLPNSTVCTFPLDAGRKQHFGEAAGVYND